MLEAFDRTIRWFGNLLAPVVIIATLKDIEETMTFLLNHSGKALVFAFLFLSVLVYNVVRSLDIQLGGWQHTKSCFKWSWRKEDATPVEMVPEPPSPAPPAPSKRRGRRLLMWAAIVGSLIASFIVVYLYVQVFVTGIYFVAIASTLNKEGAVAEIHRFNQKFSKHGYDLRTRAYASTASGSPWYMITAGSWHTSRAAAEETFEETK
ncbi:MAG: hypothetical protein PVG02_08530, partial [Anaerolineales bacterium]